MFHTLISHARLLNYTMPNTPTFLTKVGIYKYTAGLVMWQLGKICPQIAISLQWLLDVTKGGVVVSSMQLPEKILAFTFPTQKYFDAYKGVGV